MAQELYESVPNARELGLRTALELEQRGDLTPERRRELAGQLGIDPKTLKRWVKRRHLPDLKRGIWLPDEDAVLALFIGRGRWTAVHDKLSQRRPDIRS